MLPRLLFLLTAAALLLPGAGPLAVGPLAVGPLAAEAPPSSPPLDRDTLPGGSGGTKSPEIIRTENFDLALGSRIQVRFTHRDPEGAEAIGSFGVRRARLSLGGSAYRDFTYAVQVEMAGAGAQLLDATVSRPVGALGRVRVGQAKAHFGRQQLTSSGNLHFVDRTLVDGRFAGLRQAGVDLAGTGAGGLLEYGVGVYNGTGINTPNDNGRYMVTGRAVLTPLGAYPAAEGAFDYPGEPRIALGVAGLRTATGTGEEEVEITRLNLEGAFRLGGLNATAEFYREVADPAAAVAGRTIGWYVQPGFLLPNRRNEVALRYAVISPDTPENSDVLEGGLALSHYFHQHRAKIQADVRRIERKALDFTEVELRVQVQLTL